MPIVGNESGGELVIGFGGPFPWCWFCCDRIMWPLVAASIGMFSVGMDDPVWHFIAYSAGTGGSMLIIGSAAGVVGHGNGKNRFLLVISRK